jgi:hypothetical protein
MTVQTGVIPIGIYGFVASGLRKAGARLRIRYLPPSHCSHNESVALRFVQIDLLFCL